MKKEINKYDFVTSIDNPDRYLLVIDIEHSEATVVGLELNHNCDSIQFYSFKRDIKEFSYVTEFFINILGPLYILRQNLLSGKEIGYIRKENENLEVED